MEKTKKEFKAKKILYVLLILGVLGLLTIFGIDYYVKTVTKNRIVTIEDFTLGDSYDGILVLGAGLQGNGPSPMLKERLDKGIELYKSGIANIIIMSGDHTREDHDEVNVMKNYAIEKGVPSDDIFMDHAGVSTYDSVYRVKEIFNLDKIAIVTQGYHLYRALYIADALSIEAVGIDAKEKTYSNQLKRDIREILARDKDFVKCIFKPSAMYPIDAVEVSLGGNATNDRPYISIKSTDGKLEYFISDKKVISQIEKLFEKYSFSKERCDGKPKYTIDFYTGESLSIEVFDSFVHLINDQEELVLDEEDSLFIKSLIEEN